MARDDLHPGDIIRITAAAGPACRPMTARIIRVENWPAWEGMAWLQVYELNPGTWRVVEERVAYVALAGVELIQSAAEITRMRIDLVNEVRRNNPPTAARIPRPRRPSTTGRNR